MRVGGQEGMEMELWVVLAGFWQRKNGQSCEKNIVNSYVLKELGC